MSHNFTSLVNVRRSSIHTVSQILIILILITSSLPHFSRPASAADPWWDTNWNFRKPITIDHTLVDIDFTNFTILIDVTDSDLSTKAQSDGDDIAFTNSTGSKLDHEVEAYENSTGHLTAWVKLSSLSSTQDTKIYMYYGNAGAGNQENPTATWDSNHVLIHHLEETSGIHNDSTSNNNDGVPFGIMNQNGTGKIDGTNIFDGSNDYIEINHSSSVSGFTNGFTITSWIRVQNTTKRVHSIIQKYNVTGFADSRGWLFVFENHTIYGPVLGLYASQFSTDVVLWYANFTFTNDTWYHAAVVWESNAIPTFYINGVAQTNVAGVITIPNIFDNVIVPIHIGKNSWLGGREFEGLLDEIRVSDVNRSAEWIATQYNTQNDPQSFYSVGSEDGGQVYYISASSGTGGSISPTGEVAVSEGDDKTFLIMPQDGYRVTDVEVDTVLQGQIYSYEFTNVQANHTINVTFEAVTLTISLNKATYDKGQTVTITVGGGTPDEVVMLQINNPSGPEIWADQGNFDSGGTYIYQIKIPTSWAYGTYVIRVRDMDTSTTSSKNLIIQKPAPSPPPSRPPSPPPVTNKIPTSDAGPDQKALVDRELFFDGSNSKDADGTIAKYHWFFDDGESETGMKVYHIYTDPGVYNVSLAVIDDDSATGVDYATVTVESLPLEPETGVDQGVEAGENNFIVDALEETGTTVKLNTTESSSISILQYPENPYPEIPFPNNSLPTIVDIFISNPEGVSWPIYVERHYTDEEIEGLDESRLALYYYMDGEWHVCRETGVNTDSNIVWANMYQDEVTGSPTLIAVRPALAAFEVSDPTINPTEALQEETVEISVNVANVGQETGNYTVTLTINGITENNATITLDSGVSTTITFTVIKTEVGTYTVDINGKTDSFTVRAQKPPEFVIADLELVADETEPDEQIEGSVTIINIGELTGSYTVEVKLDDTIVYSEEVTIDGGASTMVTFTVFSSEEGSHTVTIDSLTATFSVEIPLTPAEFEVSGLSLSKTEVEPGEEIEGSVLVENVGEESGTYALAAALDGSLIYEEVLSLSGGQSRTVIFDVSSEEPGSHIVKIGDSEETFTVSTPRARIPWLWIDLAIIAIVIGVVYYLRRQEII